MPYKYVDHIKQLFICILFPLSLPRMFLTGMMVDKYYTPLLCLFGALGNSLSLVVFCMDSKYRSQSSSYYLSALAVSDSGFLLNLFAVWMEGIMGGVITSDVICPLVMYLGQVTCFVSVYLTVGFSVERYIAVHFPFKRPRLCTKSKAKKVIAGVTTVALILFSYAWVIAKVVEVPLPPSSDQHDAFYSGMNGTMDYTHDNSSNEQNGNFTLDYYTPVPESIALQDQTQFMCTVPEHYYKISEIANYLDSAITLIIPFLLICYFNLRIAISVWKLRDQRQYFVASLATVVTATMIATGNSDANTKQGRKGPRRSRYWKKSSLKVITNPLDLVNEQENGISSLKVENNQNLNANTSHPRGENLESTCQKKESRAHHNLNHTQHQRQQHNLDAESSGATCKNHRQHLHQQNLLHQHPSSEVRVTKTLLVVSAAFLALNLPLHTIRCTQFIQVTIFIIERNLHIFYYKSSVLFFCFLRKLNGESLFYPI